MQEAVTTEVGRVVTWRADKGYGFLRSAGDTRDLFLPASAARSRPGEHVVFAVGDPVEFQRGTSRDGRPCASWARLITGDAA